MDSNKRAAESEAESSRQEKKSRRRLRLSCVECTKRRQKCDRNYPCALCTSRGVSHLCRWESVPIARPAPARPGPILSDGSHEIIQRLSSRVAELERALENQSNSPSIYSGASSSSHASLQSSPRLADSVSSQTSVDIGTPQRSTTSPEPSADRQTMVDLSPPANYLSQKGYDTTSTLAQLSVAHHGEYVGRGALICALHSLSAKNTPRFLYAASTNSTCMHHEPARGLLPTKLTESVEHLCRSIPPVSITTRLVQAFFAEANWRFGVPEPWFHRACSEMWTALQYPENHGACINPNWLALLFSVLAFATQHVPGGYEESSTDPGFEPSDKYFASAITARRIAEDEHMNIPSPSPMVTAADGTVLNCFAVTLLCNYLAERGRVSEAWKLVGTALRSAEAIGMHRDPEWMQWQIMSEDERILRRRAWWGLYTWDKLYSFVLGRPQMIRKEIFDVAFPVPTDSNGTRDLFDLGQTAFVGLARLIGETMELCFSINYPNCPSFFEVDCKFEKWEGQLPLEYRFRDGCTIIPDDSNSAEDKILTRQRYMLRTWYLMSRVKIHIAATTGQNRPLQWPSQVNESRTQCILLAMKLIRLQCDAHDATLKAIHAGRKRAPINSNWFFEGCFSLLESTIALLSTIIKQPWEDKMSEAKVLMERTMGVFTQVARDEEGKRGQVARTAIEVMTTLQQEHLWSSSEEQPTGSYVPLPFRGLMNPSGGPSNRRAPTFSSSVDLFGWYSSTASPSGFGAFTQHNLSAVREKDSSIPDGILPNRVERGNAVR